MKCAKCGCTNTVQPLLVGGKLVELCRKHRKKARYAANKARRQTRRLDRPR